RNTPIDQSHKPVVLTGHGMMVASMVQLHLEMTWCTHRTAGPDGNAQTVELNRTIWQTNPPHPSTHHGSVASPARMRPASSRAWEQPHGRSEEHTSELQ